MTRFGKVLLSSLAVSFLFECAISVFLAAPAGLAEDSVGKFGGEQINGSGRIEVAEKITYDFGQFQRHGIYRFIPFVKTNSAGKKFRVEIGVLGVQKESPSVKF